MRRYVGLPFVTTVFSIGLALCAGGGPTSSRQAPESAAHHNFHETPSTEPLLPVLRASEFVENTAAYVAYSLASKIPQTLYQVPCYCGCDRNHGHESLLDCFTGQHGTHCRICQKEAVFCFQKQTKGKNPAEIREAMEKGQLSNFDLDKYTRRFYPELRKSEK